MTASEQVDDFKEIVLAHISEHKMTDSCDKPETPEQPDQTRHHRVVCQIHQQEAFPSHQHDNQMHNPANTEIISLITIVCI